MRVQKNDTYLKTIRNRRAALILLYNKSLRDHLASVRNHKKKINNRYMIRICFLFLWCHLILVYYTGWVGEWFIIDPSEGS